MTTRRQLAIAICTLLRAATAAADDWDSSGQIRVLQENSSASATGPAAAAKQLVPGLISIPTRSLVSEAEYHLNGHGLHAIATLHAQTPADGQASATGWVNELYQDINAGELQFSVGKKIVSWDVGYGFRPNDVVQQEQRRMLISSTLTGRPLAMAEWFSADSALSLVWVNPAQGASDDNAREQALAARWYQRSGSAELYGFARYGRDSHASLGAAAAWVADESTELHASWRYQQQTSVLSYQDDALLAGSAPWQQTWRPHAQQMLAGLSYTTASQDSYLLEYWWDGAAVSQQQWTDWNRRNLALTQLAIRPGLLLPAAANLAWQNTGLQAGSNLHRQNLYLRWSRTAGAWQTAADMLWTPEDRGRIVTLSLAWQGDRWHIDAGLRLYGGPASAIYSQLPVSRSAYLGATWSY